MHARQDQPAEMPMQWLPQLHWENILKTEPIRIVKKRKAFKKHKTKIGLIILCKKKQSTVVKVQIVTLLKN